MALASARSAPIRREAKAQPAGGPTQQSRQSAQTRARLLDATRRCIVKRG